MMQLGFEVTTDDVQNACHTHFNKDIDWETADDIMELISVDTVSREALRGDTLDEQTEIATEQIREEISNSPEALDILQRA